MADNGEHFSCSVTKSGNWCKILGGLFADHSSKSLNAGFFDLASSVLEIFPGKNKQSKAVSSPRIFCRGIVLTGGATDMPGWSTQYLRTVPPRAQSPFAVKPGWEVSETGI